jgi:hypothetical protein
MAVLVVFCNFELPNIHMMNTDPRYNKVNAHDATKEYANFLGISYIEAHNELKNYGILELTKTEVTESNSTKTTKNVYDLTREIKKSLQSGKSINDCINEMLEKEKNERYLKILQIKDLEEKLNVMNIEQKGFWVEQKARNKQLTLIAIIGSIFSLLALLKSFGFFD